MDFMGDAVMTDDTPRYDERLVRRFEPGTVERLTRDTLIEAGYELSFTRGLKKVRLRDRHDNYKKFTWTEFERFIDDLRVKQGREPIFRKNGGARATRRTLMRTLAPETT